MSVMFYIRDCRVIYCFLYCNMFMLILECFRILFYFFLYFLHHYWYASLCMLFSWYSSEQVKVVINCRNTLERKGIALSVPFDLNLCIHSVHDRFLLIFLYVPIYLVPKIIIRLLSVCIFIFDSFFCRRAFLLWDE